MKISQVLSIKGSNVVSVPPDANVHSTLQLFATQKIGCVMVTNAAGKVVGLITERDICNAIAKGGQDAVLAPVQDVMRKKIITCTPDDYLKTVMALMTVKRTRHVLVMAGKTVEGIISIGDVVKHRMDEAIKDEESLLDYIEGTGYSVYSSHLNT